MIKGEFMQQAIELSKKAAKSGEIPVGAVVVKNGEIIAQGYNRREEKQSVVSHAEIEAIEAACEALGTWRLDGCEIYVTLEPCPMCAGAIIASRAERVVFGAFNEKEGAMGSVCNLCDCGLMNRPQLIGGFMENECVKVISDFFSALR